RDCEELLSFPTRRSSDLQGMCPECNGLGRKLGVDMNKAIDMSKSLNDGALMLPDYAVNGWDWSMVVQSGFDPDKKLSDYSEEERSEEHTSELQSRENLVC